MTNSNTVRIELSEPELGMLRDAIALWLANWITRLPVDLHESQRASFDAMTDIGRKLGMAL